MGSTARAISVGAPELALIVGRAARPDSSVVVLYDGSPVSERALALAADLAGKRDVKIMIPTDETRDTRSLSAQAEWRMAERGIPASFVELPSGGVAAFARAVNREDAGLLAKSSGHQHDLLQRRRLLGSRFTTSDDDGDR